MADVKVKKKKVLKLRISGVLLILGVVLAIYLVFVMISNLPTKQIFITGTTNVTDNEIIELLDIKDYPKIFKLKPKKMEKELTTLPLVSEAKVKRNIFGKLTIKIKEEKVLFYNKSTDRLVLSNGEAIENTGNMYKIPTLINYVPDTIYEELISGLNKVDYDVLCSISEIEYSVSTNKDGKVIDDQRFLLRMNDGNTIMMNTVNIKRLNNYFVIYASIGEELGTFYLDSMAEEQIFFKSYEAQAKEEEEAKNKEEGEEGNEEGELSNQNGGDNN